MLKLEDGMNSALAHVFAMSWTVAISVSLASAQAQVSKDVGAAASARVGSITIQVVQGTEGGPAVGGDTASVEMLRRDGHMETVKTRLDAHGMAVVKNLPLSEPFRPRVTVLHAGGEYQVVGEVMDTDNPSQKITVTVHETTDKAPDWEVAMWHVILQPTEKGLHARQMLAVRNPTDRAWLGPAGPGGLRASMVVGLPTDATEVKIGGAFHSCCSKVMGGHVINTRPMLPGVSRYRLEYILPSVGGQARVELTAPARVKALMLFVPDDERIRLEGQGLKQGDVHNVHNQPMRVYQAGGLIPGQRLAFTITGLPRHLEAAEKALGSSMVPKILAVVGGVVLLALVVVVLFRSPKKAGPGEPEGKAAS